MRRRPLVGAVVIPARNRRDLLERALAGLASQRATGFEVIVVDDASTDGTPEMIERFTHEHPGLCLRLVRNETARGANASRNIGARATDAPIVCFIDSDAIPEPGWLDEIVAPLEDPSVGAATGLVVDPPPGNIYERTFRGTHRIRPGEANRLSGGNMCVRRELLIGLGFDEDRAAPDAPRRGAPDTTVSGRGDEEGLYLTLRAEGWRVVCTHGARVLHVHRYTRRSFFKQAFKGGRSAARLVYKFRLAPRLDMLPLVLAYASLPLVLADARLLAVPAAFFLASIAAITYNDLVRKAKPPIDVLVTFPLLLAYYHVRLVGYVTESIRLRLTGRTSDGTRLRRANLERNARAQSP